MMEQFAPIIIGGIAFVVAYRLLLQKVVVREYEFGLHYRNGRFLRIVEAGAYYLLRPWSKMEVIDKRRRTMSVAGQELLSADQIGLKVSLTLSFEIVDAAKARHTVQDFTSELYVSAQLAMRKTVSGFKMDELLSERSTLGDKLFPEVSSHAERIGLKLHSIQCKDIMLPGDLKKVFSEVIRAQKEGQAALERARGETATLRNLANAARMIETNPALLNLRILQSFSGPGNTLVLGAPPGWNHKPSGTNPTSPTPESDRGSTSD